MKTQTNRFEPFRRSPRGATMRHFSINQSRAQVHWVLPDEECGLTGIYLVQINVPPSGPGIGSMDPRKNYRPERSHRSRALLAHEFTS